MAVIIDPDSLTQGTEVTINAVAKTIKLNIAGNLSTDGVTLQCLYSFIKEEWKNDAALIKYPFPFIAITEEKFEVVNGWDFADVDTRNLIRTGGWTLRNVAGDMLEMFAGIITLGSVGAADQVYYQQVAAGDPTSIVLAGSVNQAVKIYGDATHGAFDYRAYFKIFVREYQKTYAMSQISDIGVTDMTSQVYRFPLANAADLKITHADAVMTTAPYTNMDITWFATPQVRSVGGVNHNFNVIIDGGNGTAEQIYEFVQFALRQADDIDAGTGTKTGKVAEPLLKFVGDNLNSLLTTDGGVYIDNFQTADTNRLFFVDNAGVTVSFPYVAAISIQFGENLIADPNAIFYVFFTNDDAGDNTGRDFGTANAIVVKDDAGANMTGTVAGAEFKQFSFDYDGNVQRGAASAGLDAPITVVAIGLSTAQYVKATGTLSRSTSNTVSLVPGLERNYKNA